MKKGCGVTVSLALLAACSGHDGAPIPSSGVAPTHRKEAEARFTIKVPKKRARGHKLKRPGYVSAATQSLKLTIAPAAGGTAAIAKTIDVTPTSAGCANVSGSTLCSFTENLAPGSYVVSVEAYDGLGGAGNLLSAAQGVPFTALAGRANSVALTLSGVPRTLLAAGPAPAVRNYDSGMRLYGAAPQPFALAAKDSDGEAIVGPGAPHLNVVLKSGSGWNLATPSPNSPTTANLTPPNVNGSTASIEIDATFDDGTCALASAVCQTSFSITNDIQTMFVSDVGNGYPPAISIYTPVSAATPTATISSGLTAPVALGLDASLDLFVLDSEHVVEYAPPYTGAPLRTISVSATNVPNTMTVSSDGHIALADFVGGGPHNVWVYAPPYSAPPVEISGTYPNGLIFDANNDLFVASSSLLWNGSAAEGIFEYAPPYNGAAVKTISSGLNEPGGMAFDRQGDLFVANLNAPSVTEYVPPFDGSPVVTILSGLLLPWNLALDYNGDLFVSNGPTYGPGVGAPATVTEYPLPYSSPPTMISPSDPYGIPLVALDNAANLYVGENCDCGVHGPGERLLGVSPPYSGSPFSSVGFSNLRALLITP